MVYDYMMYRSIVQVLTLVSSLTLAPLKGSENGI